MGQRQIPHYFRAGNLLRTGCPFGMTRCDGGGEDDGRGTRAAEWWRRHAHCKTYLSGGLDLSIEFDAKRKGGLRLKNALTRAGQ